MGSFQTRIVIVATITWSSALAVAEELDLSRVDMSIGKEPAWASGEPQYCLFVLSAERRVWFVVDGDDLYMDVNENGDLTDPGEKLPRLDLSDEERREARNHSRWRIPDIKGTDGKPMITNIQMTTRYRAPLGAKVVYFTTPGCHNVRTDPIFADRPGDAPILHPTGPHRLSLKVRLPHPALFPGAVSDHFHVDGHKYVDGLGRGTRFVLETVNLDCRIEIPLRDGSTRLKDFQLKNYITGPYQTATVILPEEADDNCKVKITLSRRLEATGPAVDPIVVEKPLAELRVVRREEK